MFKDQRRHDNFYKSSDAFNHRHATRVADHNSACDVMTVMTKANEGDDSDTNNPKSQHDRTYADG